MVLFLQFGMLTLRCDHIEECNKTLIFHLSIEDLSFSPGSVYKEANTKYQIFILKIDRLQHRVLISGLYRGKLAKNEPKIGKFQNLVITFDWGVLLTQGQRV